MKESKAEASAAKRKWKEKKICEKKVEIYGQLKKYPKIT